MRIETYYVECKTPKGIEFYVVRRPHAARLTMVFLMPFNGYERDFAEKVLAAAKEQAPSNTYELVSAGYEDALKEPRTW